MVDESSTIQSDSLDSFREPTSIFLGLSRNLWKLALVLAIAQFSIGLWKWEFGIFLETVIDPWQIGVTFSAGTMAALMGSFLSGTIADFIGRKWTLVAAYVPVVVGLIAMATFPTWPFLPLQYGLIWYGAFTVRILSRAIPGDEIAADSGRNPARKIMMVMMPSWIVDGLSPLLGTYLLSIGYVSSDLHRIASVGAILAIIVSALVLKESLGADIIEKARAGPKMSFHMLGSDFWKLAAGMITFYFMYNSAIQYLGNLSVEDWGLDPVTYGIAWSVFSLTSGILMYPLSTLADKNLKVALMGSVTGQGLVFFAFSLGNGVFMMMLLNFLWAMPFIIWIGSERSIVVLVVSEETKGRALGIYGFLMTSTGVVANMLGALIWEFTGSLRVVWTLAGLGMLCSLLLLGPVLRSVKIRNGRQAS